MPVHVCAQPRPSGHSVQEDSLDVSIPAEGQTLYFPLQEADEYKAGFTAGPRHWEFLIPN